MIDHKDIEMRLKLQKQRDNEYLADLLEDAKEQGIGIVHIFSEVHPYGGLTVAFRKATPYPSCRMVYVAVATCSPEDNFNKRIGNRIALEAFANGDTIALPLLNGWEPEQLNQAVKVAFSRLYSAMM